MSIFSKKNGVSEHIKSSPVPVKEIHGSHLPNHKLCNNWLTFAGRATNLSTSYLPKESETEAMQTARRQLQEILFEIREKQENLKEKKTPIEKMNAQLKKEYLSVLVSAYKTLMTEELKAGVVRIPCIYTVHDHTANVKSNYGNYTINYSPRLTTITKLKTMQEIANHFALMTLENKTCGVITLVCKNAISENYIPEFVKMLTSISDEENSRRIEEFTHKKNDKKYQHRDDDDPSAF